MQLLVLTILLTVNIYVNTYVKQDISNSTIPILNVGEYAELFTGNIDIYFRTNNSNDFNKTFSVNNIVNC